VLTFAGGLNVCGHLITDVDVNHGHSALEAMCVSPGGDQRLQLARQLMAAALNIAAGGAPYSGFSACNTVCQTSSDPMALANCIDSTDVYNNSGDNVPAPFPSTSADSKPCQKAHGTACTILVPANCAAP
jgi:hypothetical protein